MRRKNECVIYVEGEIIEAQCSISQRNSQTSCLHYRHTTGAFDEPECCNHLGSYSECRCLAARTDAATKLVARLRRKYGEK
jgi:hypothetical protein